jgi:hypothetical protein
MPQILPLNARHAKAEPTQNPEAPLFSATSHVDAYQCSASEGTLIVKLP